MRCFNTLLVCSVFALGCSKKDPPAASNAPSATDTNKDDGEIDLKVEDWVPAEHKTGGGRFKEAFVYLDGHPIGVITEGELPATLSPVIHERIEEWREIGDKETRREVIKEERWRVAELVEHLGVDIASIQEVHMYGAGGHALRITGKNFRKYRDALQLRVGARVIPVLPMGMPRNTKFDKLEAVLVYSKKKAPIVNKDDLATLGGKIVDGIPYYGDPARGGIRVYINDRLATMIKRHKLVQDPAWTKWVEGKKGKELRWQLLPYLSQLGADMDKVVALDVIFDGKREHRILSREELRSMYFLADSQSRGALLLGDDRIPASGFAFYTKGRLPKLAAANTTKE